MALSQPEVSKLEKRTDALISTEHRHVQALRGELEIIAKLSDGAVRINQFADLDDEEKEMAVAYDEGPPNRR